MISGPKLVINLTAPRIPGFYHHLQTLGQAPGLDCSFFRNLFVQLTLCLREQHLEEAPEVAAVAGVETPEAARGVAHEVVVQVLVAVVQQSVLLWFPRVSFIFAIVV